MDFGSDVSTSSSFLLVLVDGDEAKALSRVL